MQALEQRIRDCLRPRPEQHAAAGDLSVAGLPLQKGRLRTAAVLVALVRRHEGLTVLLTKRTEHLALHAGQISFPGGSAESADRGLVDTALRETEEEIGLHRRCVEVAGFLDNYQTVTGFLITPVVGFVDPPFDLTLDPFEVATAFELPIDFILDPRNHQRGSREFRGQQRSFYVLPYRNHHIWGATAAMLVGFANKLNAGQNCY